MDMKLISIGKTAKILDVSIDTLRRWDESGKFPAMRKPSGHRYYNLEDVNNFLLKNTALENDLYSLASYWISSKTPVEPNSIFYCQNNAIFFARITKLQNELEKVDALKNFFPLLVAMAGEIGDNSFAHNVGNWPDMTGVFFGYDLSRKQIVLADRGQGIFKTLKRVRPNLRNDEESLLMAFTEIVSGRAPEERGNGLKFVRKIAENNNIDLYFKSGNAEVRIKKGDQKLNIKKSRSSVRGCIALIKF